MARTDTDQVKLAERIGISGPSINHIVNGPSTRSEWVLAICRVTGLPSPLIEAPPEIQEIVKALRELEKLKPEVIGEFRRSLQAAVDDEEKRAGR